MRSKCPESPDGGGHHWVVKRTRETLGGQPLSELRCSYCDAPYYPETDD